MPDGAGRFASMNSGRLRPALPTYDTETIVFDAIRCSKIRSHSWTERVLRVVPEDDDVGPTGVADALARTFGNAGAPAEVFCERQRELTAATPTLVIAFEIVELMIRP